MIQCSAETAAKAYEECFDGSLRDAHFCKLFLEPLPAMMKTRATNKAHRSSLSVRNESGICYLKEVEGVAVYLEDVVAEGAEAATGPAKVGEAVI